ncbi:hypothetical protein Lepto7376_1267 [[Leptolyngbya] sp. PCC 7376]|uniref:SPOR domain-containing protein n=1 Tax=[Leptolyngbya] sp. PCC 7376 TaxID=111781 RepID=UPI00029EF34F|nr:SPOR domain-containing protein [[Leptolyngbya] sp. PCC 7376]AFY37620.1 hypothetical protein Lepto7376_1267 [[Leptolyngbya] sp. PCC 7376]
MQQTTKRHVVKAFAGFGLLGYLSIGAIATAQVTVFQGLPPVPPDIPSLRETPEDEDVREVVPIAQPPALSEFNFEAPKATTSPRTITNFTDGYRVEVPKNDALTLAAVQRVQPDAFLRGDRIQAGLFSEKDNARNLQADLREQGISAKVVKVDEDDIVAVGSSVDNAGYFVAIPTRGDSFSTIQSRLLSAGISSGLMQEKDSPRGDHIAIGPFLSRQEAEVVNTQVRAESLDSRLYFRD